VTSREAERDRGATTEYVLNQQQVFLIAEEFRSLARLRPVPFLEAETVLQGTADPGRAVRGPCLVLVKGIDEGQTFPFVLPERGTGQWMVGRRRGLDVSLEYDPFVSSQNSLIRWQDGAWTVEDLEESRNGTTRNFQPLPKGRPAPLRTGDVLGVGRSLLVGVRRSFVVFRYSRVLITFWSGQAPPARTGSGNQAAYRPIASLVSMWTLVASCRFAAVDSGFTRNPCS
jgi:hypothetical protein